MNPAAALALSMLIGLACTAGCVTERVTPPGRGIVVQPKAGAPSAEVVSMKPVPGESTTAGTLAVALKPLGTVPYDGQTLPVLSPAGGFLAVQAGAAPGWRLALGLKDAQAGGGRVDVYSVGQGALSRPGWAGQADAPARAEGLILGRGATDEGVLVERAGADGTRQIALLEFETGALRPLTGGAYVHAQGVLLRDGTMLVCRRASDEARFALVQLNTAGEARPVALPEGQPLLPVLSPDQRTAGVMLVHEGGIDLVTLTRNEGPEWRVGTRTNLSTVADPLVAYQALAGVEAMPALSVDPASPLASAITLVHPVQQRAAIVLGAGARTVLLPAGTHAASALTGVGRAGLALSEARALSFAAWSDATGLAPGGQIGSRVTMISGQYIARVMQGAEGDLVLVGPGPGSAARTHFQIVRARIVPQSR